MIVNTIKELDSGLEDAGELLEMAVDEGDDDSIDTIEDDLETFEKQVGLLEFQRMFSGDMDANSAFLDIQAGSGGTEAQDWAEMILRMYLRWAEQHHFKTDVIEISPGDVAGIKSATISIQGDYVFGWLRTEIGVHRLVRKSPFDSGNRRHTSFAAVFVSPEIDDDIDIDINPADLRIDVYRASGAGGQHVNKTESAVRITHEPTNTVVQCQNDRSQHKNKATAMKQLKAKLYELEIQKKMVDQQEQEDSKADIGWGSQIRSYVLQPYQLVKDLKQRGLLDETIVHWGGEMGRLPVIQNDAGRAKIGRDHNTYGFSMWVAGGGFKAGYVHGETDEFGYNIVDRPVHINDFNATILHALGIDHQRFSVKYQGLDAKLTGVEGARVVKEILA